MPAAFIVGQTSSRPHEGSIHQKTLALERVDPQGCAQPSYALASRERVEQLDFLCPTCMEDVVTCRRSEADYRNSRCRI
jgi:predicted RNA-binding Zn-ribbon protein involved in translation (DUF1610 family)